MKSINNYITHKALITKNTKLRPITNYYIIMPYDDYLFFIYYKYKIWEVELKENELSIFICNGNITKKIINEYINKLNKKIFVYEIPIEEIPNNIQSAKDINNKFIEKLKIEMINPIFDNPKSQKYQEFIKKYKPITDIDNIKE